MRLYRCWEDFHTANMCSTGIFDGCSATTLFLLFRGILAKPLPSIRSSHSKCGRLLVGFHLLSFQQPSIFYYHHERLMTHPPFRSISATSFYPVNFVIISKCEWLLQYSWIFICCRSIVARNIPLSPPTILIYIVPSFTPSPLATRYCCWLFHILTTTSTQVVSCSQRIIRSS